MTTETALARVTEAPMTFDETMSLGTVLAQSGYFTDAKQASQAVVKVLAGRELGIPPIAAMTGISVIQGKPSLSANLLAGLVKRSGRYNYRVLTMTADLCEIEFYERDGGAWVSIGKSSFSTADAKAAGTKNMQAYPRNMLFARAMSNGVRWYCPDIAYGPIYTPEELGANVNEAGEVVIDAEPAQVLHVDTATGEVIDAPATPARRTKAQAWEDLQNTEGWHATEPSDVRAAISDLLGGEVEKLSRLSVADYDDARKELQERNHQRKRYFALCQQMSDEESRAHLAGILGVPVPTRSALTSTQWREAADHMDLQSRAPVNPKDDDTDPFGD